MGKSNSYKSSWKDKTWKLTNLWELNNTCPNNQCMKKEITKEISKHLETNKNKKHHTRTLGMLQSQGHKILIPRYFLFTIISFSPPCSSFVLNFLMLGYISLGMCLENFLFLKCRNVVWRKKMFYIFYQAALDSLHYDLSNY